MRTSYSSGTLWTLVLIWVALFCVAIAVRIIQEYRFPKDAPDATYTSVSGDIDLSDSMFNEMIDQIATERAARLAAEERADAAEAELRAILQENEGLRLQR